MVDLSHHFSYRCTANELELQILCSTISPSLDEYISSELSWELQVKLGEFMNYFYINIMEGNE